jgi:hypothetical protein
MPKKLSFSAVLAKAKAPKAAPAPAKAAKAPKAAPAPAKAAKAAKAAPVPAKAAKTVLPKVAKVLRAKAAKAAAVQAPEAAPVPHDDSGAAHVGDRPVPGLYRTRYAPMHHALLVEVGRTLCRYLPVEIPLDVRKLPIAEFAERYVPTYAGRRYTLEQAAHRMQAMDQWGATQRAKDALAKAAGDGMLE